MQQAYQDAMAIVARYGRPTFFLTTTCNPQWKELGENLYYGQSPSDRPDSVARAFNAKLQELCTDLFKRNVLGEVEAYVYVVEFQKRGLPHCHMLLIMRENWRARTAEEVDKAVCAEIPNSVAEPELYAAVTAYMIHRQCGAMDPRSPCMQDGSCARRFPKQIRDRTTLDNGGYPNYRRRNLFPTEIQGIPYTDEWVVPFNPYLLLKYDCHINLEICGMISAVKYLYKYIYKGPDRARISIENQPTVDDNQNIDEIKQHLNTRYVCAPQSMYRIFGYSMQGRSHAIVRLAVHLPELQDVQFVQGQEQQYLAQAQRTFTTLTAFFELNRLYNEMHESGQASDFRVDPRNIYYYQIPEHFTFDPRHGWTPRMRGGNQIGRMYTVAPRDTERYCLRILLLNTKGKTSFEDLRTVDGVTYDTYTEAAKVAGFLDDDRYYRQSLQEVAHYQSAATMRSFFACLLCFCEMVQAQDLWDEFSDVMSEDYVYQGFDRQHAVALAYFDVLDRVATMGRDLREVICPPTAERPAILAVPVDYASYERSGLQQYETLNTKQMEAVDDILAAMYRADNRCISIDGPGGSGKTYLYSAVYSIAVGRRHRVLCVAWTGIAANLLPGGRTVNSVFKLNISDGNRSSSMRRQQKEAQQLREADMIIWDEISMIPKSALEAVDCLLRDIMQNRCTFRRQSDSNWW
uniref:ATP-dependent DNA helicase n=1 Tax=Haemonchus contortus TaxID=6289 RepID=A0A7I4YNI1_HAECO